MARGPNRKTADQTSAGIKPLWNALLNRAERAEAKNAELLALLSEALSIQALWNERRDDYGSAIEAVEADFDRRVRAVLGEEAE